MTFRKGTEENFLKIFRKNKSAIGNFTGCSHLDLLRDVQNPSIFTTYSHWESEEALNEYRNSALFSIVWLQTKLLFDDQPQAHSYIHQE
jgi:heme-degrading monooxygenase HmoA